MRHFGVPAAVLLVHACAGGDATEVGGGDPSVATVAWRVSAFATAAPTLVGARASVLDWPDSVTGNARLLREGTNGWTCMPSTPSAIGIRTVEDAAPMCLDHQWMEWAAAWQSKSTPLITTVGVAYMLRGDRGASRTDPFAMVETRQNDWVVTGPHVMLLIPDLRALEAIPTDPSVGGPYVMWKGTPYAHIMIPISAGGPISTRR